MKLFSQPTVTILLLAGALVSAAPSHATVTAYFSNGATCKGGEARSFAPGVSMQVSLCVTATAESLCGHTLRLEADKSDESGHFRVTGRTLGPNYPDPNNETLAPVISIDTAKRSRLDFGGTRDNPFPPAADQLLATFTFGALPAAKKASYTIRLGENSVVSVAKTGTCDPTVVVPISASLTVTRKEK